METARSIGVILALCLVFVVESRPLPELQQWLGLGKNYKELDSEGMRVLRRMTSHGSDHYIKPRVSIPLIFYRGPLGCSYCWQCWIWKL